MQDAGIVRNRMKIEGAAIAGIGMVRFDRYPNRSTSELARDAADHASIAAEASRLPPVAASSP